MGRKAAIAVDLGGTAIKHGIVDSDGAFLSKEKVPTGSDLGFKAVSERVATVVARRIKDCERMGVVPLGAGVGIPGGLSADRETVTESPNFPEWRDVPFRRTLAEETGARVLIENDANLAALGEYWVGAGRSSDSLCMLTLGTGVGGGLILQGKIWFGADGMAGEIGHVTVLPDEPAWMRGGLSSLEALTSATAIARMGNEAARSGRSPPLASLLGEGRGDIRAKDVFDAAEQGDEAALGIFRETGKYLGIAIADLVNVLNLPLFVIGGGASPAMKYMEPVIHEEIKNRAFRVPAERAMVREAELGNDAGMLGAARLVFQAFVGEEAG